MPYKETQIDKVYTIGEVADMFSENASLIRFWSDKFPEFIKPQRNKKGNRRYSKQDIENLKSIYFLVKEKGLTLEGARQKMKSDKIGVDKMTEISNRLNSIKNQLLEISKSLD
jgi:DNA-binding transcriptional MerR regulator